jgi:hypothetical protein
MKYSKMKLSLLALMHACVMSAPTLAQDRNSEGFFESSERSADEQRALYEDSRGAFLDKDATEILENSLMSQGYTEAFSTIQALQFLKDKIDQDNSRHLIYLDISDQEFEILDSLLGSFRQKLEQATERELTNVCNQLRLGLGANAADAYDIAYRGFEDSQLEASREKVLIVEDFFDAVRGELGAPVLDQLQDFVSIFSRSNSFSISLTPPPAFTSEPNTTENYMNRICKSFLGA